ncbi:hypothetical protein Dsin_020788 [Dipteronia sinensis]|uniref:Reverse transcriptase n=1 Tax=Dipteronia sinensis TaxID=43782 RepID=A0AAE0E3U5_9ROSI|nr:hypothetical protein Dsin_020788 [Dipteronia sinensis]
MIVGQYFFGLFSSNHPTQLDMGKVFEGIRPKLDNTISRFLDFTFTWEEVRRAVFDMYPTNAPGSDGLPAIFFQKYWDSICLSVVEACLCILNEGASVQEMNYMVISLIPKIKNPMRISDYRPISLCNVIYKIIAKAITNRFRHALGGVISETQCALVLGRLISENTIIGFECLHRLKCRKRKKGSMAIKLDMSKAYDRVEWVFLESMMRTLSFSEKWISLIMRRSLQLDPAGSKMRTLLHVYANASGQVINFNKSAMCVSPSYSASVDDIIWHYEENGQFSVKSSYWIGRGLMNNEGSSNPGPMISWWQSFWKTRIPIKIKIFVWKACHDWISTMVNIACRGVQTNGLSGACKSSNETTLHSLWECDKLKHIRGEWWHGRNPLRSNHSNFFDLVCDISCLVSSEEIELFYVLVWRIWFCRNSKLHGCQIYKVKDVVRWSEEFIADFRSKEKSNRRGDVRSNVFITCWKPLEDGAYKANCDAVVERMGNCVGIGTVIRDSTSAVLASCSQIMEVNFSISVAKLVAIWKCLLFCIDCGLTPCVIESYEASMVKWINDGDRRNSDCGIILSDISAMISNLHGVTVRHVQKRFNNTAQALVKNALGISEDALWMEEYPDCISKEVEADKPG